MNDAEVEKAAARKLAAALADDDGELHIYLRIHGGRVEYSIINRPDPTLSGVSDAVLVSALICAGKRFEFKRHHKLKQNERVKATRGNDTEIVFKDLIVLGFDKQVMKSTQRQPLTLQALSIVVQNLAAAVSAKGTRPAELN